MFFRQCLLQKHVVWCIVYTSYNIICRFLDKSQSRYLFHCR
nr:MAG TPA: hypothetical protein [Herelleviridae sp.]DAW67061.1 MAG TPA: hypothetical protein [Herelleviridae sp.]